MPRRLERCGGNRNLVQFSTVLLIDGAGLAMRLRSDSRWFEAETALTGRNFGYEVICGSRVEYFTSTPDIADLAVAGSRSSSGVWLSVADGGSSYLVNFDAAGRLLSKSAVEGAGPLAVDSAGRIYMGEVASPLAPQPVLMQSAGGGWMQPRPSGFDLLKQIQTMEAPHNLCHRFRETHRSARRSARMKR